MDGHSSSSLVYRCEVNFKLRFFLWFIDRPNLYMSSGEHFVISCFRLIPCIVCIIDMFLPSVIDDNDDGWMVVG